MRRLIVLAATLAVPFVVAHAQTNRVGTFDRPSIVIAFYRSPQWAATMKERIAARDSARKSGDTARVRQLEEWGASHQELAHQQLEGTGPLTNILEALRPAFDSLAKSERLSAVVVSPAADPRAVTVDVTPQLLDWLKADARTRDIIAHKPPA